jgi:hypothetical protein
VIMRRQFRAQPDLFVVPSRPAELCGSERQKARALLQALLTEAAAKATSGQSTEDKGETGDEQDHA